MWKAALLNKLLQTWKKGGFSVVFWNGKRIDYGNEPPAFTIVFHREPPLKMAQDDTMLILGEAYMDGIIDIDGSMDDVMRVIALNTWPAGTKKSTEALAADDANVKEQQQNIHHHYDVGNDFFSLWLDETLSYSCAYFQTPEDSLKQAQLQKIDHILKKLLLKPGEKLLDIGCGWGWLLIRAAQNYQVQATGITLSSEQYEKTRQKIEELGLTDQVNVQLLSYLELDPRQTRFDKIVSVGMFEHVGQGKHAEYMNKIEELLVPGGLSLLHTITGMFESLTNSWMGKYIFPGGYVPSLRETISLLPEYDFHLLHAESLRLHYAMTLDHWYKSFASHIDEIKQRHGERFTRMWSLYLRACAAAFRVSGLDVYQLLFSKGLNNQIPLTYGHLYNAN